MAFFQFNHQNWGFCVAFVAVIDSMTTNSTFGCIRWLQRLLLLLLLLLFSSMSGLVTSSSTLTAFVVDGGLLFAVLLILAR